MTTLRIETELGIIGLRLRPDAAPTTVRHIAEAVRLGLYDGNACCFYRSDFVIQCGLHGTNRRHPNGDLPVNETNHGAVLTNARGTVAVAHFDVPDNGSTEFFINLQHNAHLDTAYGGYCVFAQVDGAASFGVVDAIAASIKQGRKVKISAMALV
mmetsp:Transcript_10972/g.30321  ORF Transcript_10972/g.30321 Transcript_10972/m.30321 type:complete len:155 (-) Transcript_10972:262-726(-)|eukprot:CAMPEP_0198117684 /NCGR_PEP_ID=MMETSP1442-20131203/18945_1 /TAXON_ID= /ORGANISM="Craspedostauros australis, Strain CCMP3328" /LENGTH=154 /DNA_ID=CAMNT_0043775791 /DNA_START=96 /DNA_END=560 /DNA_ORIENTATION=+